MFREVLVLLGFVSLFGGMSNHVAPFGIFSLVFAISFAFAITLFIVGSVTTTALSFIGAGSLQFGEAFLLILGLDDLFFNAFQFRD